MFTFSTSLTYDVIIMMIIIVIDHYSQYCNCYMLMYYYLMSICPINKNLVMGST